MSSSQPVLRVSRAAFRESLRRLRRTGKKSLAPARLESCDGEFIMNWNGSTERIAADGHWAEPVYAPSSWIRTLANSLPKGDPLTLQVHGGRLYVQKYSQPCVDPGEPCDEQALPPDGQTLPPDERERRVKKVAVVLQTFRVQRADIEALVTRCEMQGGVAHSPEEKNMLKRLAEAWVLLAPFGVGTEDLYKLVQQRIRRAWHSDSYQMASTPLILEQKRGKDDVRH
jgi:hypothetical protein